MYVDSIHVHNIYIYTCIHVNNIYVYIICLYIHRYMMITDWVCPRMAPTPPNGN